MSPLSNTSSSSSRPPRLLDPVRWALYGTLVGLGAPGGMWLYLRSVAPQGEAELLHHVYLYTFVASIVVCASFGVLAGRMMARLRDASTHDILTGLANRRLLLGQLPGLLANRERRDEPLCVMMLDLDHFKRVNDTYGHTVGDKTLAALARSVLRDVRKGDLVARYGGEEFVVVCPDANEDAGLVIAERIRESVSMLGKEDLDFDGVQTISIGLACTRSDKDSAQDLLKWADAALYEAKSSGRDRVCIHCPTDLRPEGSTMCTGN